MLTFTQLGISRNMGIFHTGDGDNHLVSTGQTNLFALIWRKEMNSPVGFLWSDYPFQNRYRCWKHTEIFATIGPLGGWKNPGIACVEMIQWTIFHISFVISLPIKVRDRSTCRLRTRVCHQNPTVHHYVIYSISHILDSCTVQYVYIYIHDTWISAISAGCVS